MPSERAIGLNLSNPESEIKWRGYVSQYSNAEIEAWCSYGYKLSEKIRSLLFEEKSDVETMFSVIIIATGCYFALRYLL